MNKSAELRVLLASVGVFLDDPARPSPTVRASAPPRDEVSELLAREAIREILIAAGAPARDLEWLTASCPDADTARRYTPPPCEDAP